MKKINIKYEETSMRKAEQNEVMAVAAFMAEQFLEKEELQTMFAGIEPVKAKKIAVEFRSLTPQNEEDRITV